MFKRPKKIFAIKYYIIEIKTCILLKNNYFKQKKSFESKINAFEHKTTSWLLATFPPLVKLSNGLPLRVFFFAFGPYYEGNICVFLSRANILHCKQK